MLCTIIAIRARIDCFETKLNAKMWQKVENLSIMNNLELCVRSKNQPFQPSMKVVAIHTFKPTPGVVTFQHKSRCASYPCSIWQQLECFIPDLFRGMLLLRKQFVPSIALVLVISGEKTRKGNILQLAICSCRRINQVKRPTEHTAKHISWSEKHKIL